MKEERMFLGIESISQFLSVLCLGDFVCNTVSEMIMIHFPNTFLLISIDFLSCIPFC